VEGPSIDYHHSDDENMTKDDDTVEGPSMEGPSLDESHFHEERKGSSALLIYKEEKPKEEVEDIEMSEVFPKSFNKSSYSPLSIIEQIFQKE